VAAPNPFKGSLGSPAAAAAIARGLRRVHPDAEVLEVPVADGGEGTVDALVAAASGELVEVTVEGPLGYPVVARFGLIESGRKAVVELASASGLPLVPKDLRDPGVTSTFGFGQLLEAARRKGVRRIIAGIGGSATNDGGAGMAQALGFRLLDASGSDLPRGGAALAGLDRIARPAVDEWRDVRVEVAVDVTNPLTGPEGATYVYGPQKGASSEAVLAELDAALAHYAKVIARDLRREVAELPGAGAAGGAGAGMVAFLGAELRRGAPLVVEAAGLEAALDGAAAVFTGEGRVDAQTAFGKGPAEVVERARRRGVPAVLLAGSLGDGWETLGCPVYALGDDSQTLEYRESHAADLLELAAERALRELER
jgi:glycerate 2-kinase